ncbi:hypothetical protein V490_01210 [Pseudogymnoascus sp. VKM F-3557]|nr:hypothetical protein V490_01210 [Pseudogymnoascus sp. VKM F-3557]
MVKPAGDGVPLLYTSIVLLVVTWLTFTTRVAVRIWRKNSGGDDLLMGIGQLLFTVTACLCIVCSFLGSGQLSASIPPNEMMKGVKLFFIAEFFYASGAAFIKCSIAITLLRIADSRRSFTWTIWVIMGATGISAIVFIAGIANICHPITTLWGETTTGSCNLKLNSDVSFFFSAIEIVTDFSLAILPAILLWNIQMKARVKFSVAIILGLGAFASCATIVRLSYLTLYDNPAEFMFGTGKIGLWSIIEEGIGITAGSLHALRPLLSLPFFGSTGSSNNTGASASANNKFNQPKSGHRAQRNDISLDTFQQLGDTDADSSRHILKETEVSMTRSDQTEKGPGKGKWDRTQVVGWK